jgi:2-desacetyl-2-hydroxyethyl bacteriochlorophyllide A dehydrogenase
MNGYRVVFTEAKRAELKPFPIRKLAPDEVLVKVAYTLISAGTEKAFLSAMPNTGAKFPAYPGYSSSGHIIDVGSNVKNFNIGDRVFVSHGGHASYNIKHKSSVIKIPGNVSLMSASFTSIASYPLLALRRARVELGESVVIVGLGLLGQFGVQLARAAGALPLIAVGNREIRQNLAKANGANYVIPSDDSNLTKSILQYTNGGANVIIETSGSTDGLLTSFTYAARHARILVNGCNRVTDKPLDIYKYIHLKGVQLIGAHAQTRRQQESAPGNWTMQKDFETIMGFLSDGRLKTDSLTSEVISPEQTTAIYDRLINDRQFPLGVVFDWTHLE